MPALENDHQQSKSWEPRTYASHCLRGTNPSTSAEAPAGESNVVNEARFNDPTPITQDLSNWIILLTDWLTHSENGRDEPGHQ
jgi:hypothetical protein